MTACVYPLPLSLRLHGADRVVFSAVLVADEALLRHHLFAACSPPFIVVLLLRLLAVFHRGTACQPVSVMLTPHTLSGGDQVAGRPRLP